MKVFAWIFLFPIMLLFWGIKNKKNYATIIGGIITSIVLIMVVVGEVDTSAELENNQIEPQSVEDIKINNKNETEDVNYSRVDYNLIDEDLVVDESSEMAETSSIISINNTTSTSDITEANDTMVASDTTISSDNTPSFEGYSLIEVDGGNLSGYREAKAVVDIGYGSREYYAFTNEYGQLVKVIAAEIILQNDATEDVNSSGRYYPDEAKVPGVESSTLDEGHVIM